MKNSAESSPIRGRNEEFYGIISQWGTRRNATKQTAYSLYLYTLWPLSGYRRLVSNIRELQGVITSSTSWTPKVKKHHTFVLLQITMLHDCLNQILASSTSKSSHSLSHGCWMHVHSAGAGGPSPQCSCLVENQLHIARTMQQLLQTIWRMQGNK